jgi:uncharacterized OsmC-like protein
MSVHGRWLGGCRTQSTDRWGGHHLLCDEPESIGGTNAGPSPFSLLEMALANCTITTMWRVARDERIPVEEIEVDVSSKPSHNDETAESSYRVTCDLRMLEMRRRITVSGEINDEQFRALLWGAEHCPVSNSIEVAIPIQTSMSRGNVGRLKERSS